MRGVLRQLHRGLNRAAGALCACFAPGLLTGALSAAPGAGGRVGRRAPGLLTGALSAAPGAGGRVGRRAPALLTGALSACAAVSALSVCAAVCLLSPAASVSASAAVLPAEDIDASEELSLTITLEAEDTAVSGAEITIYRVADVTVKGGLVTYTALIGDYDYAGITASGSNEIAAELAALLSAESSSGEEDAEDSSGEDASSEEDSDDDGEETSSDEGSDGNSDDESAPQESEESGESALAAIESQTGVTGADGTVTFTNLTQGMYLVVLNEAITWESDGQTLQYIFEPYLIAVPLAQESEDGDVYTWLYAVQSLPKVGSVSVLPSDEEDGDEDGGLTKLVSNSPEGPFAPSATASVGDLVYYRVTFTAQPGAISYTLHDTMEGLSLVLSSVTVTVEDFDSDSDNDSDDVGADDDSGGNSDGAGTVLTEGTDYTMTAADGGTLSDGCTFEIVFLQSWVETLTEEVTVVVAYTARISEDAVIAGDGNPNEVLLQYGDPATVEEQWPRAQAVVYVAGKESPDDPGDPPGRPDEPEEPGGETGETTDDGSPDDGDGTGGDSEESGSAGEEMPPAGGSDEGDGDEDEPSDGGNGPGGPLRKLLTGDDSAIALWLSLMIIAAVCIALLIAKSRAKSRKNPRDDRNGE